MKAQDLPEKKKVEESENSAREGMTLTGVCKSVREKKSLEEGKTCQKNGKVK